MKTISNEGMTAALTPVRAVIDRERAFLGECRGIRGDQEVDDREDFVAELDAAIRRIHPEPDVLAGLAMVALGMLRELRENLELEGESCLERERDFCKRADALLEAAAQTEEGRPPIAG